MLNFRSPRITYILAIISILLAIYVLMSCTSESGRRARAARESIRNNNVDSIVRAVDSAIVVLTEERKRINNIVTIEHQQNVRQVLIHTSPSGDKLYQIEYPSRFIDETVLRLYLVENAHGEIIEFKYAQ